MQRTSAPNIGEAPLPQRARSYWKTRFSAFHGELEKLLEAERAQLPPWFVVGFGTGIAAWFGLNEPGQWASFLCVTAALSFVGFALGSGRAGRAIGWFALAAALGCGLVWARTSWVELPKFEHPAVTEVSGRIESVDHLAARDRLRLDPDTLSQGGGLAIYLSNEPRVDTVADRVGHHPWAEIAR